MKFRLVKSPKSEKKWRGIFTDAEGKETHTDFGFSAMEDYTQHKNPTRKRLYLLRHRARENWNDYRSAGSLSRHLLWGESTDLETNVRKFKRRFNLS